jgi:xanthine dehydrogenase accessory factor
VIIDARQRALREPDLSLALAPVVIGLGPGHRAGIDAHFVIETARGPQLGQVIVEGAALPHTGIPGEVAGVGAARLLRAPRAGRLRALRSLGDLVEAGEVVALIDDEPVRAGISGLLRGLRPSSTLVEAGRKIGDVDPRRDPALLTTISDKARCIGVGVLAALRLALDRPDLKARLTAGAGRWGSGSSP